MSKSETTPRKECDFCAPDGTIMDGKYLCPICDGRRYYDPTPLPPDSPTRQAIEAIETWRQEWVEYDAWHTIEGTTDA